MNKLKENQARWCGPMGPKNNIIQRHMTRMLLNVGQKGNGLSQPKATSFTFCKWTNYLLPSSAPLQLKDKNRATKKDKIRADHTETSLLRGTCTTWGKITSHLSSHLILFPLLWFMQNLSFFFHAGFSFYTSCRLQLPFYARFGCYIICKLQLIRFMQGSQQSDFISMQLQLTHFMQGSTVWCFHFHAVSPTKTPCKDNILMQTFSRLDTHMP